MSLLALVFLLAFIKRHGQVINAGKLYTCINVYININKTLNVKIVFYSPGTFIQFKNNGNRRGGVVFVPHAGFDFI